MILLYWIKISSIKTKLIDWKPLRALYTPYNSNDCNIVKEIRIGQSAAKLPARKKVQRLSKPHSNMEGSRVKKEIS